MVGLWWLSCDQPARFDSGATVVVDHEPVPGEVLRMAAPPDTVDCFRRTCALPATGCIDEDPNEPGTFYVRNCKTHKPLDAAGLTAPGPDPDAGGDARVVRIGEKTLIALAVPTVTSPPPHAAVIGGSRSAPSSKAAVPHASTALRAPELAAKASHKRVELHLPAPPPAQCSTSDLLKSEASRHVDLADEAVVQGDWQTAANEYRAALTMDPCSPFAWAGIGNLALKASKPAHAVRALRVAARLRPDHYGVLTSLGQAYELQGELELAADAYQRALAIRPGHPPAQQGLARVRARL